MFFVRKKFSTKITSHFCSLHLEKTAETTTICEQIGGNPPTAQSKHTHIYKHSPNIPSVLDISRAPHGPADAYIYKSYAIMLFDFNSPPSLDVPKVRSVLIEVCMLCYMSSMPHLYFHMVGTRKSRMRGAHTKKLCDYIEMDKQDKHAMYSVR